MSDAALISVCSVMAARSPCTCWDYAPQCGMDFIVEKTVSIISADSFLDRPVAAWILSEISAFVTIG